MASTGLVRIMVGLKNRVGLEKIEFRDAGLTRLLSNTFLNSSQHSDTLEYAGRRLTQLSPTYNTFTRSNPNR